MTAVLSFIEMLGRDTRLLTPRERDAYVNLIIAYEDQGAPLPDDDVRLAIGARVSLRLWRRMRALTATFFTVEGGLWRHERLDAQIAARNAAQVTADAAARKRAALSAKRSQAAKTRWEKVHDANLCKPDDLHMQNRPDADASVELPQDTVFSSAIKGRREDSVSQGENTARANRHAKPAFASGKKARKRRDTGPPQPMLRTFLAIEGRQAAPANPAAVPPHFEDVWRQARSRLCERLGAKDYAAWIAPLAVVSADAGKVVISGETRFERDRVADHFSERIVEVLRDLMPDFESVELIIAPRVEGVAA